jgi:hypothetical protein
MKKLILGIAAVFCIQAGFIFLTGTDPTADLAFSRPIPAVAIGSDIAPISSEITVFRETVNAPGTEPEAVVTRADFPGSRPNRMERVAYVNKAPKTVAKAEQPSFEPVTITIPAPEIIAPREVKLQNEYAAVYVAHDSPDYEITTKETRTEGKSFSSKVMPAIKKPFGWIKSLGSKLK